MEDSMGFRRRKLSYQCFFPAEGAAAIHMGNQNMALDPTTDAPGSATWGGDHRCNVGGNGGRPWTI